MSTMRSRTDTRVAPIRGVSRTAGPVREIFGTLSALDQVHHRVGCDCQTHVRALHSR
jgi:hypothetical protein